MGESQVFVAATSICCLITLVAAAYGIVNLLKWMNVRKGACAPGLSRQFQLQTMKLSLAGLQYNFWCMAATLIVMITSGIQYTQSGNVTSKECKLISYMVVIWHFVQLILLLYLHVCKSGIIVEGRPGEVLLAILKYSLLISPPLLICALIYPEFGFRGQLNDEEACSLKVALAWHVTVGVAVSIYSVTLIATFMIRLRSSERRIGSYLHVVGRHLFAITITGIAAVCFCTVCAFRQAKSGEISLDFLYLAAGINICINIFIVNLGKDLATIGKSAGSSTLKRVESSKKNEKNSSRTKKFE